MSDAPERIWIDDEREIGGHVSIYADKPEFVDFCVSEWIEADAFDRISEENAALRAQLATARADALRAAADRDALERLLRGYRLMRTHDEDGAGYPLIDTLTCGHTTVKEGEEECYFLADHICGHILSLIDKETDA